MLGSKRWIFGHGPPAGKLLKQNISFKEQEAAASIQREKKTAQRTINGSGSDNKPGLHKDGPRLMYISLCTHQIYNVDNAFVDLACLWSRLLLLCRKWTDLGHHVLVWWRLVWRPLKIISMCPPDNLGGITCTLLTATSSLLITRVLRSGYKLNVLDSLLRMMLPG